MTKPGVMLKRPVGSNRPFKEHAELPTNLGDATARPSKAARKPAGRKPKKTSSRPTDKVVERKARCHLRTGAEAPRWRAGEGRGRLAERGRTPAAGRRQGAIGVGQG